MLCYCENDDGCCFSVNNKSVLLNKAVLVNFQTDDNTANEPLTIENTLWANTVVASGTALGLVIYTGRESRSVMNTSQPKSKVNVVVV